MVRPCSPVFAPRDSIQRVLQGLHQAQIQQALIVEAQVPVGILTRSVLEAAVATGKSLHSPIAELLGQPPIVIQADAVPQLLTAIQALHEQSCLPVVDQQGQLSGLLLPEAFLPENLPEAFLPENLPEMPSIQTLPSAAYSEFNLRRALRQQTEALRQESNQRQQLAQDLEASKIRYRSILNNLPDLVSCFLADGTITFANRAYCQFFDQPLEAILGQSYFASLSEPQHQVAQQNITLLSRTQGSLTFEQQLTDGRWIEWTDCAICDEAGRVIEFQSIGRDITERRAALAEQQRTEATLRAREAQQRAMLEAVPDLLVRVQPDGTCLDYRLPHRVSSPAPDQPTQAQHIAEILSPDSLPLTLAAVQRALQTGQMQLFEHAFVVQDRVVHEEVRAVACGVQEVLLMVRDMTSQRQSEFQFQRLTENVPGMVYRYLLWPSGNDQMTYASPRCRELLEVEPEALVEDMAVLWDMIPAEDRKRIRQSTITSAQTLQPWCLEFRVLTPTGKLKWIRGFSRPERQPNGSIAWDGLLLDITESKQANDALQSSEAKLRSILENTPSLISLINRQSTTLFINRSLAGRSATSLIGCRFTDYLTPTQPDQLEAVLKTVFERAEATRFEAVGLGTDQPTAYYEVYIAPVRRARNSDLANASSFPAGPAQIETATVIAVDISVRKQTELALRKQEAQLLLALEAGKIVCWETDLISQTVTTFGEHHPNGQWRPGSSQMALNESYKMIHPEDRERVRRLVEDAIGNTNTFEDVHRLLHSDGSTDWMLAKGKFLADADGQLTRLVGMSINISDQRQTEIALEASEARFRAIFEHAAVGISQVSLTGEFLQVNQRYCELLGYSEAELLGRSLADVTHPDDQEMEWQAIQQMLRGEVNAISLEKRCICKTGEWRWVHLTGSWVQDHLEGRSYLIGVTEDIHDRK
ncbi:MAG: PAS domain S-box protein, partial [Elainella sp.]